MSEPKYYTRTGIRVVGPLRLNDLRVLRDKGQFQPFHDVSMDRRTWASAASLTELFTGDSPQVGGRPPHGPASAPTENWFYAAPDGRRRGPVTRDELHSRLSEGSIAPDTLVWTDGMDHWLPASSRELALV